MKKSVLFLCTENSARSLMAEALLRARAGDRFEICSAGTHPGVPDASALRALTAYGVSTEGLNSKAVEHLGARHFDFVITLCNRVRNECRSWPGSGVTLEWDFPDPKECRDVSAYKQVLEAIDQRLDLFVQINSKPATNALHTPTALEFYKCLAEETRLLSLMLIEQAGELCVCDLVEALKQPQPKISRHLAQLRKTGLLLDRRQGQWIYYRLHPLLSDWMVQILQITRENSPGFWRSAQERLAKLDSTGSC